MKELVTKYTQECSKKHFTQAVTFGVNLKFAEVVFKVVIIIITLA